MKHPIEVSPNVVDFHLLSWLCKETRMFLYGRNKTYYFDLITKQILCTNRPFGCVNWTNCWLHLSTCFNKPTRVFISVEKEVERRMTALEQTTRREGDKERCGNMKKEQSVPDCSHIRCIIFVNASEQTQNNSLFSIATVRPLFQNRVRRTACVTWNSEVWSQVQVLLVPVLGSCSLFVHLSFDSERKLPAIRRSLVSRFSWK